MSHAVSVVAGLLDVMTELTRLVALNRAALVANGALPATVLARYDYVLHQADRWMQPGQVAALIAEAERTMNETTSALGLTQSA